jgi:ArsR family transcriptional regulator, lead/cadmium/zinc/bismuth-responsive transcriptional repressor
MPSNQPIEICDVPLVDPDRVTRVLRRMTDAASTTQLAAIFAALADTTRLRIIDALAQEELCVCDLCAVVGLSQSAVSHQLRLLRDLRLVKHRRAGRLVYYSLDDRHIEELFAMGLEHVLEEAEVTSSELLVPSSESRVPSRTVAAGG